MNAQRKSVITVGKIIGGYAYWCTECKNGRAAKLGIDRIDNQLIFQLADEHNFDHHDSREVFG